MAWLWILFGFISGAALGLNFHKEEWLGGYSSLKRRLLRLGHISFFGLGAINLMFYDTAKSLPTAVGLTMASWGFIIGGITMPLCCFLAAWFPACRILFVFPVGALLGAGGCVVQAIFATGEFRL